MNEEQFECFIEALRDINHGLSGIGCVTATDFVTGIVAGALLVKGVHVNDVAKYTEQVVKDLDHRKLLSDHA